MYTRATEQDAMKDAVEMAVLSAVAHPNIVQLYACLADMVEGTGLPSERPRGGAGGEKATAAPEQPPPRFPRVTFVWAATLSTNPATPRPLLPAPRPAGVTSCHDLQRTRHASLDMSAPPTRPRPPRFRRLLPFEEPDGADTCNIIVMVRPPLPAGPGGLSGCPRVLWL